MSSCARLLTIGAILLAGASARAAPALPSPLHADDVTAWAKAHRGEISAARAKAAAAAETPKVVSGLPDPMVMVSLDHLPFNLMGWDGSVAVQQDFPLSGVLGKKKLAAEADANAANADVDRVTLDVQLEALAAYLMVVELEKMGDLYDAQVAVAKQVVEATLARLEGGTGSAAEVVRARLDVARLDGERKAIDQELSAARAMLDATLGRPIDAAVPKTAFTVPTADPQPVDKLVARAIAKRPELAVMKHKLEKAEADVAVMKSMYTPMAFVKLGAAKTMLEGPGAMVMVGVSVPIWREKLSAGVSEAKQMTVMVDAETAAMRKMIEGEVAAARGAVLAAKVRYTTAREKLVPIAKQSLTLTLASYASGQQPLVSVLDAVQMMRMAQMEEIGDEIRLAFAWAKLGRALGEVQIGGAS